MATFVISVVIAIDNIFEILRKNTISLKKKNDFSEKNDKITNKINIFTIKARSFR